jgi:hypothetical protein
MSSGSEALFRYVPLPAGRELYLPLGPTAATAGGLALYAPVSRLARTAHAMLRPVIRMGLGATLLRNRSLSGTASTAHLSTNNVLELVRGALKRKDVRFAIYQGKASPVRKPTLLALDERGAMLAFAKVGWNDVTRQLVLTEHWALTLFERQKMRWGRTAPLLGYADFGHSNVVLTGPMAGVNCSADYSLTPLHSAFLQEVGSLQLRRARLLESPFWERVNARLAVLRRYLLDEQVAVLEAGLEVLKNGLVDEPLPWAFRLGDFLPWNFGIDQANERIEVVDLEFAETDSPMGWDLFHFLIGIQPRFAGLDLEQHWQSIPFRDYFEHFEIRPELVPYLHLAYLIDLCIFFRSMWRDQTLSPVAENNQRVRLAAIARAVADVTSGVQTLRQGH